MRTPDAAAVKRFQRKLLAWYRRHGRDLPWRRTRDPYHVLVSEIMLQQTQVERVVPKYHEFLERYPTWDDLARARTADVRRTWRPLGYNIRPVRLQAIARETMARYDGKLPADAQALLSMRGIGRYTAGAVMSFAYGRDVPILDTNVRRVIARVFLGRRRAARVRGDALYWEVADALVPRGRGYDFNQALMDFGATWCTARRPRCAPCTMRSFCRSFPSDGASAR
jgi:A/G-specific adenine glycosylase